MSRWSLWQGIRIVLVVLYGVSKPGDAVAQTASDRLFQGCSVSMQSQLDGRCGDAVLALDAVHGGVGQLMTAGGPVTASPSTAGRRLAESPRIVIDTGVGWSSFRHPDLTRSRPPEPVRDTRSMLMSVRLTSAVGVFEGFSPVRTAGGVGAIDAVGTVQWLRLPESAGFSGSTVAWGGGVRIGIFRESFSLPGVTVSAMHHRTGSAQYGGLDDSGSRASLRPRATSFRLILGKDLLAVGLSGGVGWDRYGGSGRVEARASGTTSVSGPESLHTVRRNLFVGANYTWLVVQVATELSWVSTISDRPLVTGSGPYRPGQSGLQGALTVRVTY